MRFEKKTQVRKKLRFSQKNSGFLEKTWIFVNFQLPLLNKASKKLRYFSKNSGIFRETQVYGYFSDHGVVVKVHKKKPELVLYCRKHGVLRS